MPDKFTTALLYPAKSVANGIPTANDNPINVGTTPNLLPEYRDASDYRNYVLIESPTGIPFELSKIYVQGTAGDGVVLVYVPA